VNRRLGEESLGKNQLTGRDCRTGVDGEGEGGREDGDRARDRMLLVFFTDDGFLNVPNGFF
jgi:hypothetical protein